MVMAGKLCIGSPNFGSDSGWMWNCRLGVAWRSFDFAKAPICDGAMVIGPRRLMA